MMYIWIVHDLRTLQKSIAKRTPTCDEERQAKPSQDNDKEHSCAWGGARDGRLMGIVREYKCRRMLDACVHPA